MGEALVVTSGKGGVGKSALAVNLAMALADEKKKVVLVDADTGLRGLDLLLGMESRVVYDLADVAEGICRLKQALVKTRMSDRLCLVAGAQMREGGTLTGEEIKWVVMKLKRLFDFVIIDSPPGIDRGFFAALAGADRALVATQDDAVCLRDAERVRMLIEAQGLPRPMLILNRLRAEKLRKDEQPAAERITHLLEMELFGIVPEDEAFLKAAREGVPVSRGHSPAADAFKRMAKRLLGEPIDIPAFQEKGLNWPFGRNATKG